MKETPADTAQAFLLAVLLHLALFAVLFIGLWWTRTATPAAAGAISAELMDASQLSSAMRRTLRQTPEPLPVDDRPLPLDEDQAVAAGEDLLPFGGGELLAREGHAHLEVEQGAGADARGGLAANRQLHLRSP